MNPSPSLNAGHAANVKLLAPAGPVNGLTIEELDDICMTGFDVQALIEGAKSISESIDLGVDERPNQVIRLLNKAQQGVQQLQDLLDKVNLHVSATVATTKKVPHG